MQFVDKYEAIIRKTNNEIVSTPLFDTYTAAVDAAINVAAEELPAETVVCFQINHIFYNEAATPANEGVEKGG